jgi:hypothetical protein
VQVSTWSLEFSFYAFPDAEKLHPVSICLMQNPEKCRPPEPIGIKLFDVSILKLLCLMQNPEKCRPPEPIGIKLFDISILKLLCLIP